MFVMHLLNVTWTILVCVYSSRHTCVVFAVQDGEVLCLGVHVFDDHILLLSKNSRLWIIQYWPSLVNCASYLDKYLFMFVYFYGHQM